MEKSSFAAGCFWGVEHAFKQISGVVSTKVGYIGGESSSTSYKEVCGGKSGHAEAVEVTFDPNIVSFERLLDAFFFMHDATQLNRQGPDVGTQYRSAIFPVNDNQQLIAKTYIDSLKDNGLKVVTTIEVGASFIEAEKAHQDYLDVNPGGYCHIGFDTFSKLKMGSF